MTGLNHAVTGALVAVVASEPVVAFPAALASHFAIDSLPHWNYQIPGHQKFRSAAIGFDLLASILLLALLAVFLDAQWWLVSLSGLIAILPDTMWLPYILSGQLVAADGNSLLHRARRFHQKIQWSETAKGLYVEMAWFFSISVFLLTVST